MGRLFGTDGIRGVVNAGLDAELAYKVGLAAAQVLSEEKAWKLNKKENTSAGFFQKIGVKLT